MRSEAMSLGAGGSCDGCKVAVSSKGVSSSSSMSVAMMSVLPTADETAGIEAPAHGLSGGTLRLCAAAATMGSLGRNCNCEVVDSWPPVASFVGRGSSHAVRLTNGDSAAGNKKRAGGEPGRGVADALLVIAAVQPSCRAMRRRGQKSIPRGDPPKEVPPEGPRGACARGGGLSALEGMARVWSPVETSRASLATAEGIACDKCEGVHDSSVLVLASALQRCFAGDGTTDIIEMDRVGGWWLRLLASFLLRWRKAETKMRVQNSTTTMHTRATIMGLICHCSSLLVCGGKSGGVGGGLG